MDAAKRNGRDTSVFYDPALEIDQPHPVRATQAGAAG
jgi:hypothetical protein